MKERIIQFDEEREFFTDEGCFITELLNSPEDESASIARARVAPGVTTRFHRVNGLVERYVILSGQGRVEIGDLPPHDVGHLDVVVIPPGSRQRITNTGSDDLVFLAVCTPRFLQSAYEDISETQR
jgi:mannose-6-phosphate isomerase-like protein (cupin superfamily)